MNKPTNAIVGVATDDCAGAAPDVERMVKSAKKASDYLKALAHEHRLMLLCFLSERERSVTELESLLALRQPTVSQQLARLRLDGLVQTRRDGKTVYYSLADEGTRSFISLIYNRFCKV
jgi:DNA-binding transcriptional ArsR family regulator